MPLYEYECRKCGEKFEIRHSFINKKSEIMCPKCGVADPSRVYSFAKTNAKKGGFG